jgi:hypothetical protein
MSLQVGTLCYSSAVEAGRAACSQFSPVSMLSGSTMKTASCASSDAITGALLVNVVTTDLSTNASSVVQISQTVSFPACVQQDYIDAAEIIIGALLGLWCVWFTGKKIIETLGFTRGENNV